MLQQKETYVVGTQKSPLKDKGSFEHLKQKLKLIDYIYNSTLIVFLEHAHLKIHFTHMR